MSLNEVSSLAGVDHTSDFVNLNIVKAIVGLENRALYFTRPPSPYNRDLPELIDLAFRHIGIYAYRLGALEKFCSLEKAPLASYEKLEQLRALSNGLSIGVCQYEGEVSHGVDTLSDYMYIKSKMEIYNGCYKNCAKRYTYRN